MGESLLDVLLPINGLHGVGHEQVISEERDCQGCQFPTRIEH